MASYGLESALGTAGAFLMRQQERQWKKEDDELAAVRDMDTWERKQRLLIKLQEEADARMAATSSVEGDERVWRNKNGDVVNRYKISPEEAADLKRGRDIQQEELKSAQNKNDPELLRLSKENISADIDARHASAERDRAAAEMARTTGGQKPLTPVQVQSIKNQTSLMKKDVSSMFDVARDNPDLKLDLSGMETVFKRFDSIEDPIIRANAIRELRDQMMEDEDLKPLRDLMRF